MLTDDIKQGLQSAFQAQLENYAKTNTADKNKLIWDGSLGKEVKAETWYRWVNASTGLVPKFQTGTVAKTPIAVDAIAAALTEFQTTLDKQRKNISGFERCSADNQYLYLNVVEGDKVKVIELNLGIRPQVSVLEATIYHFDDESDETVQARYKNLLTIANQKNAVKTTVKRLKKSEQGLVQDVVRLQAFLLNQTKLNLAAEQEAFNRAFTAESYTAPTVISEAAIIPVVEILDDTESQLQKAIDEKAKKVEAAEKQILELKKKMIISLDEQTAIQKRSLQLAGERQAYVTMASLLIVASLFLGAYYGTPLGKYIFHDPIITTVAFVVAVAFHAMIIAAVSSQNQHMLVPELVQAGMIRDEKQRVKNEYAPALESANQALALAQAIDVNPVVASSTATLRNNVPNTSSSAAVFNPMYSSQHSNSEDQFSDAELQSIFGAGTKVTQMSQLKA